MTDRTAEKLLKDIKKTAKFLCNVELVHEEDYFPMLEARGLLAELAPALRELDSHPTQEGERR